MVVLVGELNNSTTNLTKERGSTEPVSLNKLSYSLSCYHQALAFDIEGNRSTGTLPVPGVLINCSDQYIAWTQCAGMRSTLSRLILSRQN